jgi:hypothetical protein
MRSGETARIRAAARVEKVCVAAIPSSPVFTTTRLSIETVSMILNLHANVSAQA